MDDDVVCRLNGDRCGAGSGLRVVVRLRVLDDDIVCWLRRGGSRLVAVEEHGDGDLGLGAREGAAIEIDAPQVTLAALEFHNVGLAQRQALIGKLALPAVAKSKADRAARHVCSLRREAQSIDWLVESGLKTIAIAGRGNLDRSHRLPVRERRCGEPESRSLRCDQETKLHERSSVAVRRRCFTIDEGEQAGKAIPAQATAAL